MVGLLALSTAKSGQVGNEAAICGSASAKGWAHLPNHFKYKTKK